MDVVEQLEHEVGRLKAFNDQREVELKRRDLPSAYIPFGPAYDTRSVELTPETKNFLNFCRGAPYDEKALALEPTSGQYLVSPQVLAELERTIAKEAVMRGICGQKTLKSDRLEIRSISEVSIGWGRLETGSDIPESTLVPGKPTFAYPEDLYALSKIGEDELMDSDHDLFNVLTDSFARAVSEAEETGFCVGTSHDNQQPAGFIVDTTLAAGAVDGATTGAIIIEELLEMVYGLPAKFRKNGTFLFNSLTILALRKLRAKDSAASYEGSFLWQPSQIAGQPPTLLGYPVYTVDDVPTFGGAGTIIGAFGDFKRGYQILDHESGMTIQRLVELYSEAGLVGFKLHKRVGGRVVKAANKPIVLLKEG